jgi:hypothetical protein
MNCHTNYCHRGPRPVSIKYLRLEHISTITLGPLTGYTRITLCMRHCSHQLLLIELILLVKDKVITDIGRTVILDPAAGRYLQLYIDHYRTEPQEGITVSVHDWNDYDSSKSFFF